MSSLATSRVSTRNVAIAAAVFAVSYVVWVLSAGVTGPTLTRLDDLAILAASLIALVFSVSAARATEGRLRAAWLAMAAGIVAWNLSEATSKALPSPSPADVFFGVFFLCACGAMMLFWSGRDRRLRNLILLDGAIVAGSLFIASWLLVMSRLYETTASRWEFALALGYPIAGVVLVTVAAVALVSADQGQRLVMTLLTVGLACMAVADTGYAFLTVQNEYNGGHMVDTGWVDIGWVVGLLTIAVAGAAARDATPYVHTQAQLPGWASVWLPYAPLMVAAVVLALRPPRAEFSVPVLVAGALLALTVLLRQYLAVKESRRLLAVVSDQALRDPLTGLGNRALFADRLQHAVQLRSRNTSPLALLILDLDNFKRVNDTLGHAVGDDLLQRAARRIAGAVRVGDTVARLGGDEFAVIIEGDAVPPDTIARWVLQAFDRPATLEGQLLTIRPSIGLAVAPEGRNVSADELVRQADLAMYAAKRSRSSLRRFSGDLRVSVDPDDGSSPGLLDELHRAVELRQLALVYQPKFDLADGTVVGVEALLRWEHPERGLLTPDLFLPLVRRHGMIETVTQFVIDTALDDARDWRAAGLDVPVAVNLFPPSLSALQLPNRLGRALAARGLDSSALTVEITEDVLLDDIDRTRTVLGELRQRGIRIAIDDFGSGYSALWYLRDLPVDEVKLDRGFIAPVTGDPRAGAVVRAVIDLAHVLLMKTVAEGVENLDTANWLRLHGCDLVQGYYFCAPLTVAELLNLQRPVAVKSS